ncbi:MAG: PRC-barrel domain-containing protein [Thermoplasmatales archaeon]|jgi:sporulation protein YlmC with PRC-barrel domain|nr:PRC-barrel domain-containing protein [Candidatus Thermoplasmatota archaeon]MCL6002359.1 PRC-barrel domain-containing protein [Candidatus Thermoplasmatota archaeon]MDA8054046.1 PRC-barrel domain-containing protein [Thermoplasmatales archaeon]
METDVTNLIGLEIFSDRGYRLGSVNDVIVDFEAQTIYGLYVDRTNDGLVEDGVSVLVPYRWVRAVGDVIILKRFPTFVSVSASE